MLQRYLAGIAIITKVIVILIAVASLSSCSSHPKAQVSERNPPPSKRIPIHYVAKGETLFSIAWRYGLDYRQLARNNQISSSYTIYPGQAIYLYNREPSASSSPASRTTATPPPMATRGSRAQPNPPPTTSSRSTAGPLLNNSRSENRAEVPATHVRQPLVLGVPQWQWPAQGKVIAAFQGSAGLNKGIDIAGNLGQPVIAAAAGQVVYAGSGLRGYGKLLIIKHNETFLSAYAHNEHLLVKEGDIVKAGQKIADMGSSGTDRTKLHFEIRRDGTPVNPLQYLPKR